MVVRLEPVREPLAGFVTLPYSKSVSARQILIGLHSGAPFTVEGLSEAEDTQRLTQIATNCGYRVENTGGTWRFEAGNVVLPPRLEVGEGGTTLRFALPWLVTLPGKAELYLGERLAQRPAQPLIEALREAGAHIEAIGGRLQITGNPEWKPSIFRVDASQSGQFLSALFLMASRLEIGSEVIETSGHPATLSYVERLTHGVLQKAGYFWTQVRPGHWVLAAKKSPSRNPHFYAGEADWSGAGYFWGWAMGMLAKLDLPLSLTSEQPERTFWVEGGWPLEVEAMAVGLQLTSKGEPLRGWEGDISAVPDTFPTLAALAAFSSEPWTIRGIRTLPYKESNRLSAMQRELSKIGAHLEWEGDTCQIFPVKNLVRAPVHFSSHGDHRVAMALSILATRVEAPIYIHQAEVVGKSFPTYWEVLRRIGISLTFEI